MLARPPRHRHSRSTGNDRAMKTHPASRRPARTCDRLSAMDGRLRRLSGSARNLAICVCLALLAPGCGAQGSTLETAGATVAPPAMNVGPHSISAAPLSIDAGVVADRPGYLCLPLDRVGLSLSNPPVSLTSSCGGHRNETGGRKRSCIHGEPVAHNVGKGEKHGRRNAVNDTSSLFLRSLR